MKYSLFFVLFSALYITASEKSEVDYLEDVFKTNEIVPNIVEKPPTMKLHIKYGNGSVKYGTKMYITQTKNRPTEVKWRSSQEAFYTLVMTDPDVPSRDNPVKGEWKHWVVGNIPGTNINDGELIVGYQGPAPPKNTGPHRYIFFVYIQPHGKVRFDEKKIRSNQTDGRPNWSVSQFAKKYDLGDPLAGNFMLVERPR